MVAPGGKFKRELRARAHHLKAVVQIGAAGLTDAVACELVQALEAHELIKIRIATGTRGERARLLARVCEETGATLVQSIGRVAVLYRRREHHPNSRGQIS